MMTEMLRSSIATLLLLMVLDASAADGLRALDPWIPAAPPGAPMLAGYMTLLNDGDEAVRIASARAEGFRRVELHRSFHEDGMARMRRVDGLVIEPGEAITLERGGLHLMLMQPVRSPPPGHSVRIEFLDTRNRVVLEVDAEVIRRRDRGRHGPGDHPRARRRGPD
ncbi:copper chaperone PCu(A)C [Halomonas denitrificans]|nr:copper chaperone PCu(A)C [Halomonas denitrificans]